MQLWKKIGKWELKQNKTKQILTHRILFCSSKPFQCVKFKIAQQEQLLYSLALKNVPNVTVK